MQSDLARNLLFSYLQAHQEASVASLLPLFKGDPGDLAGARDVLLREGLIHVLDDSRLAWGRGDGLPVTVPPVDEGRYDLFISYAHADDDDGMVTALVEEIKAIQHQFERNHLRVFFDQTGIRTMQDWELRILSAVKSSKAMLATLSPAYFRSAYCRKEWEWFVDREVEASMEGQAIAPLYVIELKDFEADVEAIRDDWMRATSSGDWSWLVEHDAAWVAEVTSSKDP